MSGPADLPGLTGLPGLPVPLAQRVRERQGDFLLFALTPPRRTTAPEKVAEIAGRTLARLAPLDLDGVLLYDIDDESDRTDQERPFPFLPTLDPADYLRDHLGAAGLPAVVYRAVGKYAPDELGAWAAAQDPTDVLSVFVGSASRDTPVRTTLPAAHALRTEAAPDLLVGGVAIPERHTRRGDEHLRMLAKQASGCGFFVTQVVYDVNAAKNLVSDYRYACLEQGVEPVPVVFTFSVVGGVRTLEFLRWLGVDVPRWIANDLTHAHDPLQASHEHSAAAARELLAYAHASGVPVGLSVESVSARRVEIEQSVALAHELRSLLG
ncbi:methylenetetrahydrofolate reductase [Nocardioides zeae]|uniref:Methylenetetrahydrofolate reductase n=1 Tax=Nocardioides imazamoxiresistens TaxID=3231893 RepID=A0ABU3PUH7_9ACTN|nr:methylenetetrahydrofolate reductase [Nocardioides zeae]MDT9592884.1 methylenetetrahydrofolate reductase [Nocardioides zeae]